MTVTFCGHSEIANAEEVKQRVIDVIEKLVSEGADTFLSGGYGAFDMIAARAVLSLKEKRPEIRSTLVLPYLNRIYCLELYDDTIYPPLEKVPPRFAVSRRNMWMIDRSDAVISYVDHSWGGAAAALRYAERKNKRIISVVRSPDLS